MKTALQSRARYLSSPGKGILAADESTPTIGKRLAKHGIENTEVVLPHATNLGRELLALQGLTYSDLQGNRRDYRELFLTAPGIGDYLSGCILYKETLYQSTADGVPFVKILNGAEILIGIKVDEV